MYSSDKTVAAAQKTMLEILLEVHRICEKHHLTYWLEAGTLLGAIRHKGFIPWDDDMDISMPRKDYDRFLEILPEELDPEFFLQTRETDPGYTFPFAKIRKNSTLLIETGETGEEPYHHGIFLDVFPMVHYEHGWFVRWMQWSYLFRDKKKKYRKGSLKRALVTFYTNILMGIPSFISAKARNYFARHKESIGNDRSEFLSYDIDFTYPCLTRRTDILPVRYAENVFEGHGFYLPADPHAVLVSQFGPNYMELPPEDQRKTHARKIVLDTEKKA